MKKICKEFYYIFNNYKFTKCKKCIFFEFFKNRQIKLIKIELRKE